MDQPQLITSYHQKLFNTSRFHELIDRTAEFINTLVRCRRKAIKPQAIAVTGLSGIAAGGAISYLTGLPLCVVRKPRDNAHSGYGVEGRLANRYLILDDFVSTGKTLNRIAKQIKKVSSSYHNITPECVGIVLWRDDASQWFTECPYLAFTAPLLDGVKVYTPTSKSYKSVVLQGIGNGEVKAAHVEKL